MTSLTAGLYTTTKINRAPTTTDNTQVVGETWLDTSTGKYYQLISKENGLANWNRNSNKEGVV